MLNYTEYNDTLVVFLGFDATASDVERAERNPQQYLSHGCRMLVSKMKSIFKYTLVEVFNNCEVSDLDEVRTMYGDDYHIEYIDHKISVYECREVAKFLASIDRHKFSEMFANIFREVINTWQIIEQYGQELLINPSGNEWYCIA